MSFSLQQEEERETLRVQKHDEIGAEIYTNNTTSLMTIPLPQLDP